MLEKPSYEWNPGLLHAKYEFGSLYYPVLLFFLSKIRSRKEERTVNT